MATLGKYLGPMQDVFKTSFGQPTSTHLVIAIVVFISVILIWVGASLILSQLIVDNGSRRTSYGGGGVILILGLCGVGAAHLYRSYKF